MSGPQGAQGAQGKSKPYSGGTTFESGSSNQLNLGDFIKAYAPQLPLVYTDPKTGVVTDYSKQTLQYYPTGTGGTAVGVAPTESHLLDAIDQLAYQNPALSAALLDHLNLNVNASSTSVKDAWHALEQAGMNLGKVASPQVSSLKNQLKYYNDQTKINQAAGIFNATVGQQANAIDNARNTIETWNYSPDQKKYISNILGQLVTLNGDHIVNQNALMDIFRGELSSGLGKSVDAKIKADYESAFPGLSEYNSETGAVHMSESQYQTYASGIMDSATQYGAPMPTKDQIGQLLSGHVSPAEYKQRVTDIYAAVTNADQGTKNILASQYGIDHNDLMHYMTTGNLPTMQRQVASAEIQDYANRIGLSGVSTANSQQLADMAKLSATAGNNPLGAGVGQIQGAMLTAAKDANLLKANPGGSAPTINTNQLIGSQLAGYAGTSQTVAAREVQLAEEKKAAPFEGGGGYDQSARGVTGLGSART